MWTLILCRHPRGGDTVQFHHPFLATEGVNGMHANSYNTGAYDFPAPLGKNVAIESRSMGFAGGLVATTVFDQKGRIICMSGTITGFRLILMDPDTLDIICETTLPPRASTGEFFKTLDFRYVTDDTSGGAYFHLLTGDRPIIGNSDNVIQIFKVNESGETPYWEVEQQWDLMPLLPEGSYIIDAIPDYEGNIWFVTRPGEIGYIEKALINETGKEDVHIINLYDFNLEKGVEYPVEADGKIPEKEEIENTLAICDDGIYIVSDHAMYRFQLTETGDIDYLWRTVYDRGTYIKPGAINQGSGTTPTLLDCPRSDGSIANLVAITDNADKQINVVVYDRLDGRVLACVPCFTEGKSVSESSVVGYGRSFIVGNNYSEKGSAYLTLDPRSEPGVWCVEMDEDCEGAYVKWKSDVASPTVLPKLSTKNGLVYLYSREYGNGIPNTAVAWYFTAIDFKTGKTVYKVHTGNGIRWNNSYGTITLGPNGTAYVGVFNGIISIRDQER